MRRSFSLPKIAGVRSQRGRLNLNSKCVLVLIRALGFVERQNKWRKVLCLQHNKQIQSHDTDTHGVAATAVFFLYLPTPWKRRGGSVSRVRRIAFWRPGSMLKRIHIWIKCKRSWHQERPNSVCSGQRCIPPVPLPLSLAKEALDRLDTCNGYACYCASPELHFPRTSSLTFTAAVSSHVGITMSNQHPTKPISSVYSPPKPKNIVMLPSSPRK
jgi:hypothetical protein